MQRARKRLCRVCRADLTAKPKPGTRKLKLPPHIGIQLTSVTESTNVTATANFCHSCAFTGLKGSGLAVFIDWFLEQRGATKG